MKININEKIFLALDFGFAFVFSNDSSHMFHILHPTENIQLITWQLNKDQM